MPSWNLLTTHRTVMSSLYSLPQDQSMQNVHRALKLKVSVEMLDCLALRTHIQAGGFDTMGHKKLHAITSAVL